MYKSICFLIVLFMIFCKAELVFPDPVERVFSYERLTEIVADFNRRIEHLNNQKDVVIPEKIARYIARREKVLEYIKFADDNGIAAKPKPEENE